MERSIHAGRNAFATTGANAMSTRPAYLVFAVVMAALGVIGLVYGDVALVWQRIPIEHLPGQQWLAYAFAVIELGTGLGLLIRSFAKPAAAVLFVYMALWAVLLKLPAVVAVPQMEATWLGFGEIAVILAGAWVIHAWLADSGAFLAGPKGIRNARVLFAISLPMIGLSHFFYSPQTVELVPGWLPSPLSWAYITGAGSIAACLGVLFGVFPRLAATLEAIMLGVITLLVWGPKLFAVPLDRTALTALVISAAIAGGAWIVAESYRGLPWLATGQAAWKTPSAGSA
ncbi:DoxX family membrane protein [Dyella sp. 2RAB6]|uniref:DoxX family membrane protein n=1 Tax=Dyella sp. 2RAB6 TaxID=3232992 RepID=UPI003F8FEFCC